MHVLQENRQYTKRRTSNMRLYVLTFIKKGPNSFHKGTNYIRLYFLRTTTVDYKQVIQLFNELLTCEIESGWAKGGCKFKNILPII